MRRGDVAFVVNPASANGSTGRRWAEIAHRAAAVGLEGEALLSERPGHIGELAARAVADGARLLVVVGGDGTINEAVNGLLRAGAATDVELAVLPRGTGTDFVRTFGIPRRVDAALAVAAGGAVRAIDLGRARYLAWDQSPEEAYFAAFGGAGISGAIARRANASSKALGGRISFLWATIAVFAGWRATEATVTIGDEARTGRMLEILATLGQYAAGGMWVTPEASPDDGLFDVMMIGDVTKADFVATFPKIYRGRHVAHPKIDILRGASVTVEAREPLPVTLDGEQPGTTPIGFEIVPQAIRLRVPA